MQNQIIQDICLYFLFGICWMILVEYIDSKQPEKQLTLIARIVIIVTWPLAAFIGILTLIRKSLNN